MFSCVACGRDSQARTTSEQSWREHASQFVGALRPVGLGIALDTGEQDLGLAMGESSSVNITTGSGRTSGRNVDTAFV